MKREKTIEPEWKGLVRSAMNKFMEQELPLWHDKKNAESIFKFLYKELEL